MSISTNIEWASFTASPWFGCSRVSPGCVNCYAEDLLTTRLTRIVRTAYKKAGFEDWEERQVWGPQATRVLTKNFWTDVPKWNRAAAELNEPQRLFPSMDDWLDDMPAGIIDQDGRRLDPITVLAQLIKMIYETPHLRWLLLTKRLENWRQRVEAAWKDVRARLSADWRLDMDIESWLKGTPPPNVWIGTSVENQEYADKRIPELLKIPSKVRFLSVEPLLGPVELDYEWLSCKVGTNSGIHWVIVGGESGPKSRPCNVEWIRDTVKQCRSAGVPCFVKQLGSYSVFDYEPAWQKSPAVEQYAGKLSHPKGGDPAEWPADLRVREFPITG